MAIGDRIVSWVDRLGSSKDESIRPPVDLFRPVKVGFRFESRIKLVRIPMFAAVDKFIPMAKGSRGFRKPE
ncbi:hypothetical protein GCM10007415_23000 [Parapedobacter pyrenivorans]|uniref:Uncharacterized protein n=1 Tax=Parapedobacter pyrenivorans TaxID=1305674 RepID=A0A917HTE4_9SPHI|nr:hypothetical protein GCM10007415_23000 [Parapedobacter pyrenivorans]